MFSTVHVRGSRRLMWLLAGSLLLAGSGCLPLAANLMHVMRGGQVPPEFDKLQGKRVAVVCGSEAGIGVDSSSLMLAHNLSNLLRIRGKKIEPIGQDQIDRWLSSYADQDQDYLEIGRGVRADYVLAVQMNSLRLRDGQTLFRGQCDLEIQVIDVSRGPRPVFYKSLPNFAYPRVGGQSTHETDPVKFERLFLAVVAEHISRYFCPHDIGADVALDAAAFQF
jgi:hypothetical protein